VAVPVPGFFRRPACYNCRVDDAPLDPAITLDRLAGEWWIYQLARGHRYSTDDVLTAWTALRARPDAGRVLDLGCGVGSVGLMALLRLAPAATLTAVEVQAESVALLRRTLAHNGLAGRVEVRHADLRDAGALDPAARFDLVTANPPYLPVGHALRSPHPQRAAARLELHGDVFDYCARAAAALGEGGRFCFCHSAADPRPAAAIAAAGLVLLARQEVVARAGRPPLIALFTCGRAGARADRPPLQVRAADGTRTAAYRAVRRAMLIEA
jgi:tRNA1(Val) A37 N6-methylase TrmN6